MWRTSNETFEWLGSIAYTPVAIVSGEIVVADIRKAPCAGGD
jgi:hypothetical protein